MFCVRVMTGSALLLLVGAVVAGETGEGAGKPDVVAFHASIRVDVDATGKPVAASAPGELPEAIRHALEQRVLRWEYEPARRGDMPVSATTYVSVGACALPVQGGYRLGMDFKGNGPRLLSPGGRLWPPPYPGDAISKGAQGYFKVNYIVLADGATRFDSVEAVGSQSVRGRRLFEAALKRWVEGLRYEPERVGEQPVTTRQSVPVIFSLDEGSGADLRERYAAELRARAIASDECREASGPGGLQPFAIDSPVTVAPRPAG